jgi:hypothetical protein
MKYVEREAKKCPKCGMAIQKDEGCNKMTCWNCSAYFCYKSAPPPLLFILCSVLLQLSSFDGNCGAGATT